MTKSPGNNALYSGAQAAITAVLLFLAYRFLLRNLSATDFGLWALLMSVAGLARLADFGVGTAAARFVALDLGRAEQRQAALVLQTIAVTTALLSTLLALAVWLASSRILAVVVPPTAVPDAQRLLPLMLTNLVLMMTGTALLGGLEGAQRFGVRGVVVIAANFTFVGGCLLLTESHGLIGVGVAQVMQGFVLAVGGWLTSRAVIGFPEWLPVSVSIVQLRRIGRFGASFQLMAGFQLIAEFLLKSLLTQRVGLPAAGLFEIAQRIALQLRAPIVAACQVLVPAVAGLMRGSVELTQLYSRSCRLVSLAALAGFGALLLAWPLLTSLLMGSFNVELYGIAIVISIAWGLNLLTAPAYFALLGSGSTAWNVIGHGLTAMLVGLLALPQMDLRSQNLLIGFYGVALVTGSVMVVVGLHRRVSVRLRDCLPDGAGAAGTAAIALAMVTYWSARRFEVPGQWLTTAAALIVFAATLWPAWRRVGLTRQLN